MNQRDADRIVQDIDRFTGGEDIIQALDTGDIQFGHLEDIVYASAEDLGIPIRGARDFDLILKRLRDFYKKK